MAEVPPATGARRPAPPPPPPPQPRLPRSTPESSRLLSKGPLAWGSQWPPRAHAPGRPTRGETHPHPKPGPMAAGRGGTSVRVERRGRARGGIWGLRGGECEPLDSHRLRLRAVRAGGPSGRLRARPAPPAASELTGLESGLTRERNPSRSSPGLPPAFWPRLVATPLLASPSPPPQPPQILFLQGDDENFCLTRLLRA